MVGPSYREAKELLLCRIFVWSGAEATAGPTSLAPHKAMLSHGLELLVSKQNDVLVLFLDEKPQFLCGVLLLWG